MKAKDGFVLRSIADSWIAVPIGSRTKETSGVISFSETGAFLWNHMQTNTTKEKLTSELTKEFEVDDQSAAQDVESFIDMLLAHDLIEK